ncbi:MAG: type II toxin-antitoxin system mRNA interferase toxin, RelE/StbE family [Clostridiales bacterium]|nr:type II toxin-antitoxin system mRNA interferase toxin, RelE/StbE family [Clostridiales bacterium]
MKIIYHKIFLKSFKKLSSKNKEIVKKTIGVFSKDPFDKKLKNHALKGRMQGKRAISIKGDFRIIFVEQDEYLIVMILNLEKHNRVYK